MPGEILFFGEISEDKLAQATEEIMGIGRKLADGLDEGELTGVFIGEKVKQPALEAIYFGADKAIVVEDAALKDFHPETFLSVLEAVCKEIDPDIVLMNHNFAGAELSPRLAARLGGGLTTDCVALELDDATKQLLCTKPIYGGNVLSVYSSEGRPQMATIREKVFPPAERNDDRKGELVNFSADMDMSAGKVKIIDRIIEDVPGVKLEQAEAIVCGGRGLGSSEGFRQLEELAELLNGAVAGTRPTCEKGWINSRFQVGITGKKVAPKLYIAVGVSGAIQHMTGVESKCIVGMNKDPDANIFRESHYGVVGDYAKILPAFTKKVREIIETG